MTAPNRGLNGNSYISIGLVVLMIGIAVRNEGRFNAVENGQKVQEVQNLGSSNTQEALINGKFDAMRVMMDYAMKDRWTRQDMMHWSSMLKSENKELMVPDPKHEE